MFNIYDRNQALLPEINDAVVIGVGGIGSWTAFLLAIHGIRKLVVIDPDTVEASNLNRTPFMFHHIGVPKVDAIENVIEQFRPLISVEKFKSKWEDINGRIKGRLKYADLIFDFRDIKTPLSVSSRVLVTGGYDGLEFTLHLRPSYKIRKRDNHRGYRVTPSVAPVPFLVAGIAVSAALLMMKSNIEPEDLDEYVSNYTLPGFLNTALGVRIFKEAA